MFSPATIWCCMMQTTFSVRLTIILQYVMCKARFIWYRVQELQISHACYPPSVPAPGCDEAGIAHTGRCLASSPCLALLGISDRREILWTDDNFAWLFTDQLTQSVPVQTFSNPIQDMTQPLSVEISRTFLPCINKRIWDLAYHEWVIPATQIQC